MRVQGKPVNTADEDCPLWHEHVSKHCHRCPFWISLRGTDPNTGQEVDEWGCTVPWLATLMVENSQQQRQTGAAVESFRNEMVNANERTTQVVAAAILHQRKDPKLIE